MAFATCPICDRRLTWAGRGRKPRFCSENCRAQSQRIRRRLRKAGTPAAGYDDIRRAERQRRDALRAAASEKQSALAQLPPFQRAVLVAKRAAKAARQRHLDFFGADWTLALAAEYRRWCEIRSRLNAAFWTGNPEHPGFTPYDACEADRATMEAKSSAIKELRMQGDSEAAAELGEVVDFWQPRHWRTHWLRRLHQGAAFDLFPHGEPDWIAVASEIHQTLEEVAQQAFRDRLETALQAEWQRPCLPQSEAPALALRLEDRVTEAPAMGVSVVSEAVA